MPSVLFRRFGGASGSCTGRRDFWCFRGRLFGCPLGVVATPSSKASHLLWKSGVAHLLPKRRTPSASFQSVEEFPPSQEIDEAEELETTEEAPAERRDDFFLLFDMTVANKFY